MGIYQELNLECEKNRLIFYIKCVASGAKPYKDLSYLLRNYA